MTNPLSPDELVLKRCPFCGYFPHLEHIKNDGRWKLGCQSAHCIRPDIGFPRNSKEQAIAAWNTRAAIAAMPDLTELQQRVKQLEEGLHSAKAAIDKTLKAHSAARDMVPDEEEGLAAQVFAYHINGTESLLIKSSEQARSLLSDKGED